MSVAELSAPSHGWPPGRRDRFRHQPLLGGLLVKDGLINRAQLERVLRLQRERKPRPLLGRVLLDERLVTSHELETALSRYERKRPLGDVLVETNAVTPSQLEAALATHSTSDRLLGDTLIELGLITERQLKQALGAQLGVPFVDLDTRQLDPRLTSLISEHYARHYRVIPVEKVGDRIVLAMDDPTDRDVVAEVRACTGHSVDVVVTTVAALERAFTRGYGDSQDARAGHAPAGDRDSAAGGPPMERVASTDPSGDEAPAAELGREALSRTGQAGSASGLEAFRARLHALRRIPARWEKLDASGAAVRERIESRSEIARLTRKLRDSRAALADAYQELEAKGEALARLQRSHAKLLTERRELQERHDALLRDREFVIERVTAILGRLRS